MTDKIQDAGLVNPISAATQVALDLKANQATTYTKTETDTAISNLVDAAPATLDTLNELAAALGDDPNFATTVTNSIGTKWTQDNTKISNWDTAYSWGNHASAGYLTSLPSHNHDDRYSTRYKGTVVVPNASTYQQVCKVNGSGLGAVVRITLVGTSGNVVVDVVADIIVNHSQDIVVQSMSGSYTQLYIQVVSDGNDDFDIRLRGTGSVSNTQLAMEVHTLNGEGVTFTTTQTYSGSTLTHLTKASSNHISSAGGAASNYWVSDNRVFNDAYHPNADKWTTARTNTVTLTGDASGSGSASVDGTGNWNVSVPVVVNNDSHSHSNYLTAGSSYDLTGDIRVTSGSLSFYGDTHMGFIPYPNGGQFRSDSGSLTGYIKISLPDGVDSSDDMISFWVDIFDYTTSESVSLFIGGYNYQSTGNYWVNCTAQVFTKSVSKDYTVRFGFDGTRKFVTIGEPNSTWSHPSVVIRDFQTSFRGNVTHYRDDWNITTSTSAFSGVDETQTGNLPVSSSSKKWATARTLSLTGDVTGSVSWDGSANATLTATVANDSHSHSNYLPLSGGTLTDTLTTPNLTIGSGSKIKFSNNDYIRYDDGANRFHFDVDGGTSNASLQAATFVGALSGNASTASTATTSAALAAEDNRTISPNEVATGRLEVGFTSWANNNTAPYADFFHLRSYADSSGGNDNLLMLKRGGTGLRLWQQTFGSTTAYTNYVDFWNTGNDGSGSGLDADLLDGQHGSYYLDYNNFANTPAIPQGDITAVAAGTGLTGGGTSGSVTLNVIGGSGITANANDIAVDSTVVRTTGNQTIDGNKVFTGANVALDNPVNTWKYVRLQSAGAVKWDIATTENDTSGALQFRPLGGGGNTAYVTTGGYYASDNQGTLWGSSNDGSGSGLDADLLDGQHASAFLLTSGKAADSNLLDGAEGSSFWRRDADNTGYPIRFGQAELDFNAGAHTTISPMSMRVWDNYQQPAAPSTYGTVLDIYGRQGHAHNQIYFTGSSPDMKMRYGFYGNNNWNGWFSMWNSGNDGSGSGLDADLLDGQHASAFQSAGTYNTIIGTDSDINTSGSTIIDNIYVTDGVITSMGTRTLTAGDIGALTTSGKAADSNLLDGRDSTDFANAAYIDQNYYDFYVGGDANTYYPCSISEGGHYGFHTYSISRGYSWTAPSTWNTSSHKGGLTFTFQNCGDGAWGGNDKTIRVIQFAENYSKMVGGLGLSTGGSAGGGVIVWLRGGNAKYRFHSPKGSKASVTVHLASVTASNGTVFPTRSYSSTVVNNEVNAKYPVRSTGGIYSAGNNPVWHAGNDGSGSGLDADLLDGKQASAFALAHSHPYAATSHSHTGLGVSSWNGIKSTTPSGYIEFGPANSGHAHIYTDRPNFYLNKDILINNSKVWHAGNDGSGSGLDADLLDGVNGASYLRSDATDYLNATLYVRGDIRNETAYRDHGVYGSSDSTKTNHIWSMGSAYRNSSSGANFGNLYGLAYKHTNNATGGTMGGGHQMVWCNNGSPRASMGYDRLWHATSGNTWGSSNDGSGSGLDADLLDGQHASAFQPAGTYAAAPTSSKNTSGYWKCATTGVIIQWGTGYIAAGNTTATHTFPIAFPVYCRSATITTRLTGTQDYYPVSIYSRNATQIKARNTQGYSKYYDWIAIGY